MSANSFFNTAMLERLAHEVNTVHGNAVMVAKPTARAMLSELRRFYGQQDVTEQGRVELVQKLTMQYACQHICDLLRGISDTTDNDDVAAAFMVAVSEIMTLSEKTEIKTMGSA